jgi:hypothetical protein
MPYPTAARRLSASYSATWCRRTTTVNFPELEKTRTSLIKVEPPVVVDAKRTLAVANQEELMGAVPARAIRAPAGAGMNIQAGIRPELVASHVDRPIERSPFAGCRLRMAASSAAATNSTRRCNCGLLQTSQIPV